MSGTIRRYFCVVQDVLRNLFSIRVYTQGTPADELFYKTISEFRERFPISKTGCIFYDGDVKKENNVTCIPIFMTEYF